MPTFSTKTDVEIKFDIQDELWWSPSVDADQMNIEVVNGTATLTGQVDSWSEWQAAKENAYEGGATWVHNKLEVHIYRNTNKLLSTVVSLTTRFAPDSKAF